MKTAQLVSYVYTFHIAVSLLGAVLEATTSNYSIQVNFIIWAA